MGKLIEVINCMPVTRERLILKITLGITEGSLVKLKTKMTTKKKRGANRKL